MASESNEQAVPEERNAFEITGFNQGEFVSTIGFSHRATADPIVAPGDANFKHAHDFFANTSTNETPPLDLCCWNKRSAANEQLTYWPCLINEGSDGLGGEWSYHSIVQLDCLLRVLQPNDPNDLINMPVAQMIAGSAMPQERQSRAEVFWNYIGESVS